MNTETKAANGRIGARELRELQGRAQIVDVRSPREFEEGHVPGAVNVPLEQLESRLEDLSADDSIVLVCHSGHRAELARGFLPGRRSEVLVLDGGTEAWIRAGLPVVRATTSRLSLMRQVQIVAGGMTLAGTALGSLLHPAWYLLAAFVGAGLMVAGATGFCGLANLLALLPWNNSCRASAQPAPTPSSLASSTD